MNSEFLEHYERELRFLYEQSRDFAAEYPGIAERLGGLTEEKMDPGVAGLLEGTAFLAARVQLKLKSEFAEFTTALLDQLLPNYLAPLPSSVLVQASPQYDNPRLARGLSYPAGSYIDANYVERERRVSCRYRLAGQLTLWPLRIEAAEYLTGPGPLRALGVEVLPATAAGLRLSFHNRTGPPEKDVSGRPPAGAPLAGLAIEELPIHLIGNAGDADAVLEQVLARCRRISLRYLDQRGDPQLRSLGDRRGRAIGFADEEGLQPADDRVFQGFEILRDYFAFPAKYRGFRIDGLHKALAGVEAHAFDLIFEFDTVVPHLASIVGPAMFALHAVPATNLFEMTCSRIPVSRSEHEHPVVADRSRWLDFEVHRILEVFAHYPGRREKIEVFPLYSLPSGTIRAEEALYYTARRLPRLPTEQERRFGRQTRYAGTETFISLFEPAGLDDAERVKELSVRALVSNRHLTEQLPVGDAGADFRLTDDVAVVFKCVAGPTPPRDSLIHVERKQRGALRPGPILWRLVNFLSLNQLGLAGNVNGGAALRELLALFADLSDGFTERQVRGIENVTSRPVVRMLRQANGFNPARGIEVTITFDEAAFEGTGVMALGAVLDHFLAEYAAINSFTETVIASSKRGEIMRWPPRNGLGGLL